MQYLFFFEGIESDGLDETSQTADNRKRNWEDFVLPEFHWRIHVKAHILDALVVGEAFFKVLHELLGRVAHKLIPGLLKAKTQSRVEFIGLHPGKNWTV